MRLLALLTTLVGFLVAPGPRCLAAGEGPTVTEPRSVGSRPLGAVGGVARAATAPPAEDLTGLWWAKRRFGPDARGELVITRAAASWSADFMGGSYPVQRRENSLSFALPDSAGSFAGRVETDGRTVDGHWTQPNSVINGFQYASPVQLTAIAQGHWRGIVRPREDDCTFYLMLTGRPDGTYGAMLRNPDRNFGRQYGIDRLVRDGDSMTLMGRASERAPERAVARGSFDAARNVLSLVFPDQGGTYDFTPDRSEFSGFYPRGREPKPYHYQHPPDLGDGWPTASLEDANIDRPAIEKFIQMIIDMPIESVHTPEVEAVLLARHGKLVLEEYFHGFDRDTLHDTRSAGKSITATVAGAAMCAGVPLTLSTPVYRLMNGGRFPANLGSWKRAMTLEDLLTMRSGFYCSDSDPAAPGNEDTMIDAMLAGTGDPDFYHYVLNVPMSYPPNTVSIYCSTNPNLALGMVGRASGESPLDTFDRLVGRPMQIDAYAWPLDGVGHPYGGGGIRIRPRDFLKLGQLMLNGGTWQGRRIISRTFVARAAAPLHDLNAIQYGYLWWSINLPYKNRTVRAYFAGGNGGQGILVVPDLDLVIAIFAGNYGDQVGLHLQEDYLPDYILPAVREPGDDPNSPVVLRDFRTPYAHPPVVVPAVVQN